eukprot:g5363.t1
MLQQYGVPLMVGRLPTDRKAKDRSKLDNQIATFLKVQVSNGFADPHWQSHVGSVLLWRPGPDPKPFTDFDLEVVWEIVANTVDRYGDGPPGPVTASLLTKKSFEKQVKNYLGGCFDWNAEQCNILNDNTGKYAGLSMDEREKLLQEHEKTPPVRGLSKRFEEQHLVRREGGMW